MVDAAIAAAVLSGGQLLFDLFGQKYGGIFVCHRSLEKPLSMRPNTSRGHPGGMYLHRLCIYRYLTEKCITVAFIYRYLTW